LKTKNFTFFQALRQTLAESEGLSASDLKPCIFNGFEPPDFVVCTSRVYQCRSLAPRQVRIPDAESNVVAKLSFDALEESLPEFE